MKVIHRVAFRATTSQRKELEGLGAKVRGGVVMPGGGDPFVALDVEEDDQNWPRVHALLELWHVSDGQIRTEFSRKELGAARWLEIGAWHHGYPQPHEGVFGYLKVTYDLTEWCEHCGIGKKQKASFQMKGEPKWGRNGILQLIWIYEELFVTPEVWSRVFKPAGIGHRSVMNTKGRELETVVQLAIQEEVGIVTDGLNFERCPKCGRVKYLPVTRGPSPMLASDPVGPIARTKDYFGSGGQADKRVLVSQALARSMLTENVRGASFRPVQSSNSKL